MNSEILLLIAGYLVLILFTSIFSRKLKNKYEQENKDGQNTVSSYNYKYPLVSFGEQADNKVKAVIFKRIRAQDIPIPQRTKGVNMEKKEPEMKSKKRRGRPKKKVKVETKKEVAPLTSEKTKVELAVEEVKPVLPVQPKPDQPAPMQPIPKDVPLDLKKPQRTTVLFCGTQVAIPDLDRSNLHDSTPLIEGRAQGQTGTRPEQLNARLTELLSLKAKYLESGKRVRTPQFLSQLIRKANNQTTLLFELGFGCSTYDMLEWCIKNKGQLVTIDLPIAPVSLVDSSLYEELFDGGVDRYEVESFLRELQESEIGKAHWLWVNEEIGSFLTKLAGDEKLRKLVLLGEHIDFLYEDARYKHQHQTLELLDKFVPIGGILSGEHGFPSRIKK